MLFNIFGNNFKIENRETSSCGLKAQQCFEKMLAMTNFINNSHAYVMAIGK